MRRLLPEQRRGRHINAQEVLAAVSFLEVEERTGRMDLDTGEFCYVLQRFSELAKLYHEQVWPHASSHILRGDEQVADNGLSTAEHCWGHLNRSGIIGAVST